MPPSSDRIPFPDRAHEALAQWVEETIADTDDSLWLVDVLFGLAEELLAQRDGFVATIDAHRIRTDALIIRAKTAQECIDLLQEQVADLTERLAALEAQTTPDAS